MSSCLRLPQLIHNCATLPGDHVKQCSSQRARGRGSPQRVAARHLTTIEEADPSSRGCRHARQALYGCIPVPKTRCMPARPCQHHPAQNPCPWPSYKNWRLGCLSLCRKAVALDAAQVAGRRKLLGQVFGLAALSWCQHLAAPAVIKSGSAHPRADQAYILLRHQVHDQGKGGRWKARRKPSPRVPATSEAAQVSRRPEVDRVRLGSG